MAALIIDKRLREWNKSHVTMDRETTVTTTQDFLLFDCQLEQYSINFSEHLLSPDTRYTVHYTYPDDSTKSVTAEFVREHQLLVKNPPEFKHPCTVSVEVFADGSKQCLAKFSLDLVSPVEYLFRKYSQDHNEMCSSDRMTSALLAMSLSYYYVMEEQMKMERKADEILATLLTGHRNTTPPKHITSVKSATCDDNIKEFAQHHQLKHTLQCLSDPSRTPPKYAVLNGQSETVTDSSAADMPEEGHYVPLIKVRGAGGSTKYTSRTAAATNSAHHSTSPHDEHKGNTENDAAAYEVPINPHLEHTIPTWQPVFVQPYAVNKLEHSVSLGNITDKQHEYIECEPPPSTTPRRPRPPRPPPPKKKSTTQQTLASSPPSSSATRRLPPPLDRRKSAPLAPTPKHSSSGSRWQKSKH